jgi:hypothetical protein
MPGPTAVEITLSNDERSVLQAWTPRRKTAQALALRAAPTKSRRRDITPPIL